MQDPLDLIKHLLTLLPIDLFRLVLEEVLDLRQDAIRVPAFLRGEAFDARSRVAARALHAQHDAAELLLAPGRQEGRALHGPDARPDPDNAQIANDHLRHREVGQIRYKITNIETIQITGLHHEL